VVSWGSIVIYTSKEHDFMRKNESENKYGAAFIIGIATAIITILSLVTTILVLKDKKKKKEDKQLEDYLENTIQ